MGYVGEGGSIQQFYYDIPIVTRTLITCTIILASLANFHIIEGFHFVFQWELIKSKFHIWRLFTPFVFYGGFSFNLLMFLITLYQRGKAYEINPFNTGAGGTSADFLYMIMIGIVVMTPIAIFMQFFIMSESILYYIMYVWSRREPEQIVNIFGFKLKALYLPWAFLAIHLLMGKGIILPLVGIFVGHLYYFLVEVLPNTHDIDLIRTPKFVRDIIAYASNTTPVAANPSRTANTPSNPQNRFPAPGVVPNPTGGHQWGRGNRLGAD